MAEPEDEREAGGRDEPFQVKRHGKYEFSHDLNRRIFVVDGYTIYRVVNRNSPRPEQQFGFLPGRKKWTNRIEAEEAAKRATEGWTEGIEIAVGYLPYEHIDLNGNSYPDEYTDPSWG
ncbi:hypothetical protein DC522_21715 [Microvirga sp. KLBC 81]|uniref:hypothetical protein n=1 Tax=Microvirga sp. KLBC 81 TaxID=1862707 RepID=UPI000D52567F|nr:hypothetical protein [Microvirga sp. KLBC 81]PVE22302.1 hypothetical protein DC522_21715 [Microvirga sp. KLBC 81]